MMADGLERALADADCALELFPPASGWRASAFVVRGAVHALLGATDLARADLAATVDTGLAGGATEAVYVAQAVLALLAARRGAWDEAGRHAGRARALVEEAGLGDYPTSAIAHVAAARVALHDGRQADARAALTRAHRMRPAARPLDPLGHRLGRARAHTRPPRAGRGRLRPHRVHRDRGGARAPAGPGLPRRRRRRSCVSAWRRPSGSAGSWAMSLTGAELRLLPYLATHLTFPEIGAPAVHLAQHGQERGARDLSQAGSVVAEQGDRARGRGRPPGRLDLPPEGESHPGRVTRAGSRPLRWLGQRMRAVDEYEDDLQTPRRLAYTTTPSSRRSRSESSTFAASVLGERATALVRIGAIIAVDAAPSSFQHAVAARPRRRCDEGGGRRHSRGRHARDGGRAGRLVGRRSSGSPSATTSRPRSSSSIPDESAARAREMQAGYSVFSVQARLPVERLTIEGRSTTWTFPSDSGDRSHAGVDPKVDPSA